MSMYEYGEGVTDVVSRVGVCAESKRGVRCISLREISSEVPELPV